MKLFQQTLQINKNFGLTYSFESLRKLFCSLIEFQISVEFSAANQRHMNIGYRIFLYLNKMLDIGHGSDHILLISEL